MSTEQYKFFKKTGAKNKEKMVAERIEPVAPAASGDREREISSAVMNEKITKIVNRFFHTKNDATDWGIIKTREAQFQNDLLILKYNREIPPHQWKQFQVALLKKIEMADISDKTKDIEQMRSDMYGIEAVCDVMDELYEEYDGAFIGVNTYADATSAIDLFCVKSDRELELIQVKRSAYSSEANASLIQKIRGMSEHGMKNDAARIERKLEEMGTNASLRGISDALDIISIQNRHKEFAANQGPYEQAYRKQNQEQFMKNELEEALDEKIEESVRKEMFIKLNQKYDELFSQMIETLENKEEIADQDVELFRGNMSLPKFANLFLDILAHTKDMDIWFLKDDDYRPFFLKIEKWATDCRGKALEKIDIDAKSITNYFPVIKSVIWHGNRKIETVLRTT